MTVSATMLNGNLQLRNGSLRNGNSVRNGNARNGSVRNGNTRNGFHSAPESPKKRAAVSIWRDLIISKLNYRDYKKVPSKPQTESNGISKIPKGTMNGTCSFGVLIYSVVIVRTVLSNYLSKIDIIKCNRIRPKM